MVIDNRELKVHTYLNATIVPFNTNGITAGLYDNEGNMVEFSSQRNYNDSTYDVCTSTIVADNYNDKKVIFLGGLRNHYGHFLIDEISRLWFLVNNNSYDGFKIICYSKNNKVADWIFALLECLNIPSNRVELITSPTRYNCVIYGELSFKPEEYITYKYYNVFNMISQKFVQENDGIKESKIYLSRVHIAKNSNTREYGEKVLEKVLKKAGYHILYPEEMRITEQLAYYCNCNELVTTVGTLSHNVVFVKRETIVILIHRFWESTSHQKALNSLLYNKPIEVNAYSEKSSKSDGISLIKYSKEMKEWFLGRGVKVGVFDLVEWKFAEMCFNLHIFYRRIKNFLVGGIKWIHYEKY